MKPAGFHTDWLWPFSRIPRGWNSWDSDVPPVRVAGNATGHLDVVAPGTWALVGYKHHRIPVCFVIQTKGRIYFRLGLIRYDYEAHYYTAPTGALRKYD